MQDLCELRRPHRRRAGWSGCPVSTRGEPPQSPGCPQPPIEPLVAVRRSWCARHMDDEEFDPWVLDEDVPNVHDICPLEERLPAHERIDDVRWAGIFFELNEGPPFQPGGGEQ